MSGIQEEDNSIIEGHVYVLSDVPSHLLEKVRYELMVQTDPGVWKATKVMGNTSRRLQFTIGPDYRFGNTTYKGQSFNDFPYITLLKNYFEERFGKTYGMAHVNIFPGQDEAKKQGRLSWHGDTEAIIDQNVPIIGVSLGESMRVQFRKPGSSSVQLITEDKQVYVMNGSTFQTDYQHCVEPLTNTQRKNHPTDPQFFGVRYSITFRGIK